MDRRHTGEKLRVMTFNLRFENDTDGSDGWETRRRMAVDLIQEYSPDILGTQEGKWSQLIYLQEMLPEYQAFMPDRVYDPKIQCPTLFVREKRFEILEGGDIWLSETPGVHLSKSWDSAFPRMMSHSRMHDRKNGIIFHATVTHLDHIGIEARRNQAGIIARYAKTLQEPKIVMGDFNEGPGSDVHRILTATETGLVDTWEALEKPEDETSFTHHGFTGVPRIARLDWILSGIEFKVLGAGIIRDHENGSYPSDHFPYMADLACEK